MQVEGHFHYSLSKMLFQRKLLKVIQKLQGLEKLAKLEVVASVWSDVGGDDKLECNFVWHHNIDA